MTEPPCYCAETSTRNCPRHADVPTPAPVGAPDAGGPVSKLTGLPANAEMEVVLANLQSLAGVNPQDVDEIKYLCWLQHESTRAALQAELAGTVGEEIAGLLDNFAAHERYCLGCEDDELEQASAKCEAAKNAIKARFAALAAQRDEAVARLRAEMGEG